MRIALVSTPWPLFNRPSIQLGALKAFLRNKLPEVDVDAYHLYLQAAASLGYHLYEEISQSTWLAEPLYGALLYPERSRSIEKFWRKKVSKTRHCKQVAFEKICEILKKSADGILASHDWGQYQLIGFSICFSQVTSALYFISQINKLAPHVPIVVGGSSCSGELGHSLLRLFPQIKYVIEGEGELPLLNLLRDLEGQVPGRIPKAQISNLDELPAPDFDDYFRAIGRLGPDKKFFPKLPVEMSRGCWWNRCAFCNLNLQWKGYRSKSKDKMIAEIQGLSDKHQVLAFSFMDNLLPQRDLESFFHQVASLNKDYELFAEIRATTPPSILEAMGRAGMREVQVGVEALSSGLLKKINKGTTAIDNVEIMKNCERPGFPSLTGNLIMEFPGSDEKEVNETLAALDFVRPFRPLKAIPFWLGYGSPVWQNQEYYGIKRAFNHSNYRHIFPEAVLNSLITMIQGYHGDLRRQRRLWKKVRSKVADWEKEYKALHQGLGPEPILSYRDGGDFLIIRHRRVNGYPMTHKLTGTSRKIYMFCESQREISEVVQRFPNIPAARIEGFLKMMADKRLMFKEGSRYLSLAVPVRSQIQSEKDLPTAQRT